MTEQTIGAGQIAAIPQMKDQIAFAFHLAFGREPGDGGGGKSCMVKV
jgi:hypothetical protein